MKRLPLLWRIFLSTSIFTTLLFVLIAYLVHAHVLRTTSAMFEDELRSSFRAYHSLWTSRSAELASLSQVIAGMADVRAAFGTRDEATIRDSASELWARISRLDAIFLVTDPEGRIIASLSGARATSSPQADVVRDVSGNFPKQGSGFAFMGDRLFQVVVTPVYVDAGRGSGLLNVLVAGFAVDDAFAAALKNSTAGSDSLIIAGGRVVASTVPRGTAADIARASLAPGQFQQIHAGEDTWSVLPFELTDVTGGRIGEVRVMRPMTAATRTLAELRVQIVLVWLVVTFFALLVTYVLTRRLLGPVRLLDTAAREVSLGNYNYRVPVTGDDEMGRLARTFNAMCGSIRSSREELIRQERITTLGRVASSIVHDLRNPLAAIYGGAEMLVDADGLPPTHTRRLAGNIYAASRQILRLLDDLTAATRGKNPELETCRLRDVVDDAWSGIAPQAEEAGVKLVIEDVDNELEAPIRRSRIERVLGNLFTNAVQAMTEGGEIRVGIRKQADAAVVTVCDTGPGVPAAIRENLFQPFTSAGKSNGLGLGLALSRQTVLEHGGDLWLEQSATGACFRLRLPLAGAPKETVSATF